MYQFMAKSAGYKTVCKKQFIGKSDWKDTIFFKNYQFIAKSERQDSVFLKNYQFIAKNERQDTVFFQY